MLICSRYSVRLKRTLVARSAAQNTFNMLADDSTSSKPAVPSQGYDLNGSNRIYEPGIDGPDLEEFCMVDEKTGKKILLTRVTNLSKICNILCYF